MKNLLKLIILLFVCGLMILSGCATPSTSLPKGLAGQAGDYPNAVNILAPDFFKATGATNAETVKQQWLEEMSERYGVKLNIISRYDYGTASENNSSSASSQVSKPKGQTSDRKFVGLTSITSIRELKTALENDSIVPLEDYLSDNPVWNALPDDYKSLFEVDGHIYAIPNSVSQLQNARFIHDEALQTTGITVSDLDSFHDFAVAYAQEPGNIVISGISVTKMTDILNAFGLYPANDAYTPFSYDPSEDCYVDFMTKGAAVDALEYLRELYKAGALYWGSDPAKVKATFDSGIFASAYQQYFDYDNCTEVLTLNPEYPQVLFTGISGFAMTQDTPQPQETINFLIDMLFGSEQNYLECRLGSSDNYILNSDGTITVEMAQDSEGHYVPPCMPNLTGGLSDIFPYSDADIFYSKDGAAATESDTDTENYNARFKMLNDSLQNGTIVEIPLEYQIIKSTTYDANVTDAGFLYSSRFIAAIISSDNTVQQIVEEYKEKMLNLGGNAMLDEMNAAIGKQTAYYYG